MHAVTEKKGINGLELGKVFKYENLLFVSYTFVVKKHLGDFTYYLDKNSGKGINVSSKSHKQRQWSRLNKAFYKELKAYLARATEIKDVVKIDDLSINRESNDVRKYLIPAFNVEQAEELLKQNGYSDLELMVNVEAKGKVYLEATKDNVRKHFFVSKGSKNMSIYESKLGDNSFKEVSKYNYATKQFIFNKDNYREVFLELYKFGFSLIYKNILKETCEETLDVKTRAFRERMVEIIEQKTTNFADIISLGISEFNKLVETSGYTFLEEETLKFKGENKVIYSFSTLLEIPKDEA